MCSTMAGPMPGSAPAGNIIQSCRSRCRSRRYPDRGSLGPARSNCLPPIEAVTVHNELSSAHITFVDDAGAGESATGAAGSPVMGIQYHWLNRGYKFVRRLPWQTSSSRQAQDLAKGACGSARRALHPRPQGRRNWSKPNGTRCGLSTRTPASRKVGPALPHPRVLRPASANAWPTKSFCSSRAATVVPIAGALNFVGPDTLYGRYWGTIDNVPFLHFELCYYQAIEWAIEHRLGSSRPEPKASTRWRGAMNRWSRRACISFRIASFKDAVAEFLHSRACRGRDRSGVAPPRSSLSLFSLR